jgi:hypothetical protein
MPAILWADSAKRFEAATSPYWAMAIGFMIWVSGYPIVNAPR